MNVEKLRDARKMKGYSQEDLANLCNVSRQAVSKWESGQSVPDAENLLQISKYLEVSIDYLLDNEDMSEQKVKVRIDIEDLEKQQELKYKSYEYVSKTKIFGIPLVHINRSRYTYGGFYGYRMRPKLRVAKGIIAIGDISIGLLSIGLFSIGLLSLGIFSLAILGLAIIQVGVFSFGLLSFGFATFGVVAIGVYSTGIVAIASDTAIGVATIGKYSIGIDAVGSILETKIGDKSSFCELDANRIKETSEVFMNKWLPWLQRWIYQMITNC